MNEKKDMKTCIRPCVLMINECDKRYIIFKIFFTLIQGLLPATFIIIMQKIINLIQKKADVREILLYTCMYLVLLLLENINGNIEEFYTSKFSLKFNNSINLQILEKSTKLELVDYENPETYDFINRAKSQNGSSILAYVGDALDVVKQFVMLGSTIAILINLKWWIVVIVLIFPLIRSLITYAIDKKWFDIRIKRTKKERKIWYINYLLTAGNAFKEIKLYGVAANLIGKFKKMTGEIIEQDKKMLKNIFFISLGYDLLELCFSGIILFYTINLGITGAILIGDVTAYIDSVEKVKESAKGIFTGINNLFEETLYLNLLFEFLNKKINDDIKGTEIKEIKKIEFKNVSFKYANGKYALHNINLQLDTGARVAFVGENGSGKTTLIKLILGLYQDYEGDIFINDINLKEISLESYYKKMGCVFQDYVKYEMSIKDNITLGVEGGKNQYKKLWNIIEFVDLKKRIEKLGINSTIGNWFGSSDISIGEWQRLAIARAFYREADVYFFDEADASLDILLQKKLFEIYKGISKNKILIYISHKINYVHLIADYICVLNKGEIVEEGSHDELIKKEKKYYKLYNECKEE